MPKFFGPRLITRHKGDWIRAYVVLDGKQIEIASIATACCQRSPELFEEFRKLIQSIVTKMVEFGGATVEQWYETKRHEGN